MLEPVKSETLQTDIKGLYFSAHWCPPCRGFTPKLAKVYKEVNKEKKKFENVFISRDRSKPGYYKRYALACSSFRRPRYK